MAPRKTYSVFVGHLSKEVSKADLRELFSGCGEVVTLFIVENDKPDCYNYAFIRYSESLMAKKAVSELNRWTLKGVPLVVSIAKDTVKKIAEEKLDSSYSVVKDGRQKSKGENSEITGLKSSNHVDSVMYLSRLKDNCTALNLDLAQNSSSNGGQDGVNVHMLIEDIKKTDCSKVPPVWGDLTQRNNTLQNIKERLFERAKTNCPNGSMGQKKAQEFLSSLNTVISTVNSFLKENMETSEDTVNDSPKVLTAGENSPSHKMSAAGMTDPKFGKDTDLSSDLLTLDPSVFRVIQSNPVKETIPSELVRSDSQTSSTSEEDCNDFISDSGIECDGGMLASPVLSKTKDRSSKTVSWFCAEFSPLNSCESQDSTPFLVRSSSPRGSIVSLHTSSLELVRSPIDTISNTSPGCMSDDDYLLKGKITKSIKEVTTRGMQPSSHKSICLSGGLKMSHSLGRGRGGNLLENMSSSQISSLSHAPLTCPAKPLTSLGRGHSMNAILDSAKMK